MLRRHLLALLSLMLPATVAFAQQQVTFNSQTYAAPNNGSLTLRATGDLNNDSATDVITNGPDAGSVYVLISNADGSFQTARAYPAGASDYKQIVTADVDGDGNADVLLAGLSDEAVFVLYGKGDGTLSAPVSYSTPTLHVEGLAVADFTGDGKKDIVAVGETDTEGAGFHARLLLNNGARKFTASGDTKVDNTDTCCDLPTIEIGDFDGDGHADFFVKRDIFSNGPNRTMLQNVVYGDGAGHFTAMPTQTTVGIMTVTAADLNGDGKTDLVDTFGTTDAAGNASWQVQVFLGSSTRNMQGVTLADGAGLPVGALVADYNGDGKLDVAFMVDGLTYFALQRVADAFPKVFTVQKTGYALVPRLGGDFNHDGEPDIADVMDGQLMELQNTTTGGFANYCAAPAHGISICTPSSGTTVPSPVAFKVSAGDFSPIRKLEVWVNGSKLAQSFYSYFDKAYFSGSIPLSNGTHTATILATDFDHTQIKKDVTFTVGAGAPPPGTCPAPTSTTAALNVCSPTNGMTMKAGSTLRVQAAGTKGTVAKIQLLVDGVKKATSSSNVFDFTFTFGVKGSRRFDFNALNSAGRVIAQKTVFITVQ